MWIVAYRLGFSLVLADPLIACGGIAATFVACLRVSELAGRLGWAGPPSGREPSAPGRVSLSAAGEDPVGRQDGVDGDGFGALQPVIDGAKIL